MSQLHFTVKYINTITTSPRVRRFLYSTFSCFKSDSAGACTRF